MTQSDFLSIIKSRGFLHQCTDEADLESLLDEKRGVPAYIGFDCTAPSLHVGSLMQIMLLRWWQKSGNKPIVLMGGGTTKIGDPSGKDASRPQITDETINANMQGIKQVFARFLQFGDGANDAKMVNNDEWLKKLNYVEFLRDYGIHFSVNRMMSMDSVKLRLTRDQHLSFLEFNYMILQAYDFVELNRQFGCRVQMGGSDQWGNIVMGITLDERHQFANEKCKNLILRKSDIELATNETDTDKIYKAVSKFYPSMKIKSLFFDVDEPKDEFEITYIDSLFGITTPLLTTASGTKMGKTEAGAVWLNAEMTSPYEYWQFWRNTEDADVGKFLKLFTEIELNECERLGNLQGAEINEAKKILATEATALLHGREEAEKSERTARETFEQGGTSTNLPEVTIPAAQLAEGMPAFALFFAVGLATSNSEARRLIAGRGARVNDVLVEKDDLRVDTQSLNTHGVIKLSSGKKKHVLVRPV
jgi:tyrosyl-tRNA synthetase